jgi:hypothetical protein
MFGTGDGINSFLDQWGPWILAFAVIFFFFAVVFGGTIMDLLSGRVRKFKDLENQAHLIVYRELQASCKLSKGIWSQTLWQKSLDPMIMTNSPFGMTRRGRVKGRTIWGSAVYIWFRPRTFTRSYILICPIEMLVSSIDDIQIIVEGTELKNFNLDYVLPIPSKNNRTWTEETIRTWARFNYKYIMTEKSDYTLRDFEEHLKLKAGSDPTSLRMIQQGIGDLAVGSTNEYQGDQVE